MTQNFTREQIDSLISKARAQVQNTAGPGDAKAADRFDPKRAGQPRASQIQAINALHELFVRQVSTSLGVFLAVAAEIRPPSIEQIPYEEFVKGLPQPGLALPFRIQPRQPHGILQMDLSIVFPLVDLLLGGTGKDQIEPRELTEIEQDIFEPVLHIIATDLTAAWRSVFDVNIQFERSAKLSEMMDVSPAEKVVCLTFEAQFPDCAGKLRIALPPALSTALLRKASAQKTPTERVGSEQNKARLQKRLLKSVFEAELLLPTGTVSVGQLATLGPGSVVILQARATEPIHLNVAGENMFLASPVRSGSQRSGRIQKVLSIVPKEEREDQ